MDKQWVIVPIRAKSDAYGECKSLSLSVEAPYNASATLDLYDRCEVEALIADLREHADRLWPGKLI